jgi:hypothetical protein
VSAAVVPSRAGEVRTALTGKEDSLRATVGRFLRLKIKFYRQRISLRCPTICVLNREDVSLGLFPTQTVDTSMPSPCRFTYHGISNYDSVVSNIDFDYDGISYFDFEYYGSSNFDINYHGTVLRILIQRVI